MKKQSQNLLIENFEIALNEAKNKSELIEHELEQVKFYINTPRSNSQTLNSGNIYTTGVAKLGTDGNNRMLVVELFKEYNIYGQFKQTNTKVNMFGKPYQDVAIELVEYYQWLKGLISSPSKKPVKSPLTHKQKMLALHYMGLDLKKFQNDLQTAKILSLILGLDESNTKENLTYLHGKRGKVKTPANLKRLLQLFEHEDFKPIQNEIKAELEN